MLGDAAAPRPTVERLELLFHIQEVLGSYLGAKSVSWCSSFTPDKLCDNALK
jgi:hypothetical protein